MKIKWKNVLYSCLIILLVVYFTPNMFFLNILQASTLQPSQNTVLSDSAAMDKEPVKLIVNDHVKVEYTAGKNYKIEIIKHEFKLYLKDNEQTLKAYNIAIGLKDGQKQRAGDMTTPTGEFFVEEVIDSTSWTHDFKDGNGEILGAYGPWFISLETGWDGIGIHGTHDPKSIGTKVSEGCIRMLNSDVIELKKFVKAANSKENATVVSIKE